MAGGGRRVYSSKTNTRVSSSDPTYTDWLKANVPNPIASEAELAEVLKNSVASIPAWLFTATSFIQPALDTYDKDQLAAYTADAQVRKNTGGAIVNGLPFATDPVTMMSLNAAYIYTIDKQTNAFSWKLPDGTFITLDTDGVKALQSCIAGFGQSCFACEDETLTAVEGGTITTLAQIDAAFAAVSNVFTSPATFGAQRHRRESKKRA